MKFERLLANYESAKRVNAELLAGIPENGIVSLQYSQMCFNAGNDLSKAKRAIIRAFNSGKISKEQYLSVK